MINTFTKRLLFLITLLLPLCSYAQSAEQSIPPSLQLENPYEAAFTHLYYLQQENYQPKLAAKALYFEQGVDSISLADRAIKLKQIFDGLGLLMNLQKIPTDNYYVDSSSQLNIFKPFPDDLPEIYLQKQKDNKWYYSPVSVRAIPSIYARVYPFDAGFILQYLPDYSRKQILGLALWQYVGLSILLILLWLLHLLLKKLLQPAIYSLSTRQQLPSLLDDVLLKKISTLLSLVILLWLFRLLLPILQFPVTFNLVLIRLAKLANLLLLVFIAMRAVDVIIRYATRYTEKTESKLDEQLMPIVKRSLQGAIVLAALIQGLRLVDVDITALIAGISIGGLALALAAQDTVKNLIGSITIFTDQPFQIGDWIEGSDFSGTVIEVGFRTTRLRRPDSSIIAVPNGAIVNMNVQNLGVREYRLLDTTLGLTYDTSPDLIEQYIQGLQKIAETHPKTDHTSSLIFFREMADSSLNIFVRIPIITNNLREEFQVRQDILLAVLRLAEKLGVSFAFPSTSVYVESTPGHPLKGREGKASATEIIDAFIKEYEGKVNSNPSRNDN